MDEEELIIKTTERNKLQEVICEHAAKENMTPIALIAHLNALLIELYIEFNIPFECVKNNYLKSIESYKELIEILDK